MYLAGLSITPPIYRVIVPKKGALVDSYYSVRASYVVVPTGSGDWLARPSLLIWAMYLLPLRRYSTLCAAIDRLDISPHVRFLVDSGHLARVFLRMYEGEYQAYVFRSRSEGFLYVLLALEFLDGFVAFPLRPSIFL